MILQKNIVGDEGTVDLLIGAGSEPHEYELSAKGRAMIQDSDVFVYENGKYGNVGSKSFEINEG